MVLPHAFNLSVSKMAPLYYQFQSGYTNALKGSRISDQDPQQFWLQPQIHPQHQSKQLHTRFEDTDLSIAIWNSW